MKQRHYAIHCPGFVYAMDIYGTSKKDALAQFRRKWLLDRMPRGYAIWEV
jgi:hypothetical protein